MKNDNCIFCKIANGEIPSRTICENEKFRVILDNGPATEGDLPLRGMHWCSPRSILPIFSRFRPIGRLKR